MLSKNIILKMITEFYLNSRDFNGLPVQDIIQTLNAEETKLKDILISLIREKKISLTFGDVHPNPHIKAFWEEPEEKQIVKLKKSNLVNICAYPSSSHLKKVVDQSKYQDRPFTLRLALGEPQLSFESFDLVVLESYRNDPRYEYTHNDISGRISLRDKYHESEKIPPSDRVFLQTFGFSYDSDFNRAVAVFLVYLSCLSPQHQQIWDAKILKGNYELHPDYFRTSILGQWPAGISIFDAFRRELHHINEMCKLMDRPALFKNELKKKPRGFGFLIRPTLKEYNDFVHLLDKAISENIDRKFFKRDVSFKYDDEVGSGGKVVVRQKGTIQVLDEWLKEYFETENRKPIKEMIGTFKEIRKLRQGPAHGIAEDSFNQKYFKQQRELIRRAYKGIRLLRLIFANHPDVKGYKIPNWDKSKKIWIY